MAKALIIGGSLAGLTAALLLRRRGWQVDVYERAELELAGRGAGIVTHPLLWDVLDALGLNWRADLGVSIAGRRVFDHDGALAAECAREQTVTSWDRLYAMLRAELPAAHYHKGKQLSRIEERGSAAVAHFLDGGSARGDLLVGADGLRSTVRAHVLPEARPSYAGYTAWRGLAPEAEFSAALHRDLFAVMAFCLPPGEQVLGYPVAGTDNDLRPGHRRYNVVWYRPADPAALTRLLTDTAGNVHSMAIPPPLISPAVITDMRAAAEAMLAPQFRDVMRLVAHPFLQPIYDIDVPNMAFGRIAIIGDAAFVARPHVGAGVAKAMQDALALADALSATADVEAALRQFEIAQLELGRRIVARGRQLGACLQAQQRTPVERDLAARYRVPETVIAATAALDFLTEPQTV